MRVARVAWLAVALTTMIAAAGFTIDPAELNRVTFVNNTGYDIVYLFFSPGDSDYWGADVLGTTRTLDDGEKIGFYIHYPDTTNAFDFLAIDEDGDAYVIWDFEVTDGTSAVMEVTLDDLEGGYDMPDLATVNLTNESGYDMWYLFFSPADSAMWGTDMLGDDSVLGTGDTLSLFVPVSGERVRFDFQSVDEDEDVYEFQVVVSNETLEYAIPIELSDLQ